MRRLLQDQVDLLEGQSPDDLPEQVRSVLRAARATGRSSAGLIAALFGMHGRSLTRRLSATGRRFQQFPDETRFEISRQLPEESAMEVGWIAEILGYATHGAFTRAFQRWTGLAPVDCRPSRRGGP